MPANLFIATAQNIKPLILTIVVKLFLDKPFTKTVNIQPEETKHQFVISRINKTAKFDLERANLPVTSWNEIRELTKKEIRLQGNRNFGSIFSNLGGLTSGYDIDGSLTMEIALKSHQALLNLAKVNFEEKIIATFINHLYHPSLLQTEIINNIVKSSNSIIKIVSSFDISEPKKIQLITAVRETITTRAKIQFELQTNFSSRIELRTRYFKIHWNLRHYLIEIEATPKKSSV